MSRTIRTLAIAAGLLSGVCSFALAQSGTNGNPAYNAAHSGGPGTHVGAQHTGSASNTQKTIHNQNGYRGGSQ